MRDKNGKKICEGDIIRWFDLKAKVIFKDGQFKAKYIDSLLLNDNPIWERCEVITSHKIRKD